MSVDRFARVDCSGGGVVYVYGNIDANTLHKHEHKHEHKHTHTQSLSLRDQIDLHLTTACVCMRARRDDNNIL